MSEAKGIDRRTKVYRDLVDRVPKDEKFIEEILDGTEYRYAPEPRCFAGETKVITRNGILPISELAGGYHELLTETGDWIKAPIQSFGKQSLMKMTLKRNKITKTIYATPNHIWLVKSGHNMDRTLEMTTKDIQSSKRKKIILPSILPNIVEKQIIDQGVARGFTFGDGAESNTHRINKKSRAFFFGSKDDNILPYFINLFNQNLINNEYVQNEDRKIIYGLPNDWKTAYPSLEETPSYLYSWLAGYFAADGRVDVHGNAQLYSADLSNLQFVQTLCHNIGMATYGIQKTYRKDRTLWIKDDKRKNGGTWVDSSKPIYSLIFVNSTLESDFFLLPHHRNRWNSKLHKYDRLSWRIESVETTDRVEEVFCAVVPETETFVLEDYILTHNCRVCSADDPRKQLRNGRAVKEMVELLLAAPKKVAQIHSQISPLMEDWPVKSRITDKSIRTHLHKHMPWDRRAFRLMAEHWAAKKGLSIMDASERMMLTEEAWLQATTEMGYQNLIAGNMTPNWSEVQKAWERFSELQRQVDGEFSSVELLAELEIIIQTIREFIPPDQWATVLGRIEQKKQMANLGNKRFIDSEAEEAELVDDDFLDDIENEQQALLAHDDAEDDLTY